MHPDPGERITVGISANMLSTAAGLDGIGVYTSSLELTLKALGVVTRRIGAPTWVRRQRTLPESADIAFPWPLEFSIAATAAVGLATPFATGVEQSIDVYHATDYLVPKLRHTPVVATLYDAIPLMQPDWARASLRTMKNRLLRSAAAAADRIIAISHAAVDEIVEWYGVSSDRIRVIHLGVDEYWFESPTDPLSLPGGDEIAPGFLLCVGTLQPRKNISTLLAAYDSLPVTVRANHQLVIVGKYGWGAEALRSDLAARRDSGRCLWLEYVDRETLRSLYANAAALVFPSLAEGFGLPILEAMAAGTPVVANELPVLQEVAGSLADFVDAENIDALRAALEHAAKASRDPDAAERRRLHARQFRWRTCAEQTLAVYRELI
jgi:glycosyltransferase involved in cell wall biosynthesis